MINIKEILKQHSSVIFIGDVNHEEIISSLKVKPENLLIFDGRAVRINDIRQLISWLSLRPFSYESKVIVIYKVESLGLESANALLKTIEEPPSYANVVFFSSDENGILPTIKSRCIRYRLQNVRKESEIPDYLSPEDLAKKTVKERFQWVDKVYESEYVLSIIDLWERFYQEKLLEGRNVLSRLRKIEEAKDLLQSNISVKLLLENLTLMIGENGDN